MLDRFGLLLVHPRLERLVAATTLTGAAVWLAWAVAAALLPGAGNALARLGLPLSVSLGIAWVWRGRQPLAFTLAPALVGWLLLEAWGDRYPALALLLTGATVSLGVPAPWSLRFRLGAALALCLAVFLGAYVSTALAASALLSRVLPWPLQCSLAGAAFGFLASLGHVATQTRWEPDAVESRFRVQRKRGPVSPFAAQALHLYRRMREALPHESNDRSWLETRRTVSRLVLQVLTLSRQAHEIAEDVALSDVDDLHRRLQAMRDAAAGATDPGAQQHYRDAAAVLEQRLARLRQFGRRRERIEALCHHCIGVLENLRLALAQARLTGNAVGLDDVTGALDRLSALQTELDCTAEALRELEPDRTAAQSSPSGPLAPEATA